MFLETVTGDDLFYLAHSQLFHANNVQPEHISSFTPFHCKAFPLCLLLSHRQTQVEWLTPLQQDLNK